MIARALAAAAAVAALMLAVQTLRLSDAHRQLAQLQASVEGERASAEHQARTLSENYRALEKKHHAQLDQLHTDTQAALAAARGDADRARAAGGRLRQQLAAYTGAAGGPADPAAPAGPGTPEREAARVLAELLGAADELAGTLAVEADNARTRGSACERQYDAALEMIEEAARHAQAQ